MPKTLLEEIEKEFEKKFDEKIANAETWGFDIEEVNIFLRSALKRVAEEVLEVCKVKERKFGNEDKGIQAEVMVFGFNSALQESQSKGRAWLKENFPEK